MEEPSWDEAECRRRDIPTRAFFYEDDFIRSTREYYQARDRVRAICHACPIRRDCAEWAMLTNQVGGMWGGMTSLDRIRERRRRYRIAQFTLEGPLNLQGPHRVGHDGLHERSGRSRQ